MFNVQPPIPLTPGCPWSTFEPPVIHFCEENLCSWITQPANTWSNLAYVIVGIVVFFLTRKQRNTAIRWIGPIAVMVGLTSGFYHASYTRLGEFFDLSAMFMFSSLLLTFNLIRYGKVSRKNQTKFFIGLLLGSSVSLLIFKEIGIGLFTVQIVTAVVLEYLLFRRRTSKSEFSEKNFLAAVGCLIAAQIAWQLDFRGIVCNPSEHMITGHAIWHTLTAMCFYFAYLHYLQFKSINS